MEALLWIIMMLLLPLFTIVVIWTKMHKTIRAKIIVTLISVFSMFMVIAVWVNYNNTEKAEWTIGYVVERDDEYLDCLDKSKTFDESWENCIIPNVKLLRKTYERE